MISQWPYPSEQLHCNTDQNIILSMNDFTSTVLSGSLIITVLHNFPINPGDVTLTGWQTFNTLKERNQHGILLYQYEIEQS